MITDKPYTPFQLAEDAKFDGTNLSGWQRAMLLHGATSGQDLYWKGMVTWLFELTKELTVPPPPDREAEGYKPTAIFSRNPSQIEWTLREGRAKIALLTNIKNPDALGFDYMEMTSEEIWKRLGKEYGATNKRLREIPEKELRDYRWMEGNPLTSDKGHFTSMEKLRKKATDLGANIPNNQYK